MDTTWQLLNELPDAGHAGFVQSLQGWGPGGGTQGGAPRKLGAGPGLSSFAPLGLGATQERWPRFWTRTTTDPSTILPILSKAPRPWS